MEYLRTVAKTLAPSTWPVLRLAQLPINSNTATKCLEGLLAWSVFRKEEKERRRKSEEHEYLLALVFRALTEPNSVKFLVISQQVRLETLATHTICQDPTYKQHVFD